MAGAAPQEHTGRGGKKPLDAELNLVPFIDLLSCCISFLLITAVWTQIAGLQVSSSGGPPEPPQKQEQTVGLKLLPTEKGYQPTLPGAAGGDSQGDPTRRAGGLRPAGAGGEAEE